MGADHQGIGRAGRLTPIARGHSESRRTAPSRDNRTAVAGFAAPIQLSRVFAMLCLRGDFK
jgi:hypothetical protein